MTSVTAGPSGDRTMAAVAYILTWVTGLIVFFVAKKEDKYARWHAVQAIGLGIEAMILSIAVGILRISILSNIIWLLILVAIVVLAVKAYQGEKLRIPFLADFADKYA